MSPRLSVVAPVYNEAAILEQLGSRCLAAARRVDPEAEVLLIDDGSTDDTVRIALQLDGVHVEHLPDNVGQLRATLAGLALARGDVVVVLDGDLQDPPEHIGALVERIEQTGAPVVFAVKTSRDDPAWFRIGRGIYGLLMRLPGVHAPPAGSGAYCAMSRDLADRAAAIQLTHGNLSTVLVALEPRCATLPYDKEARYDGASRVRPVGLAREALASLLLTGALRSLCLWVMLGVSLCCGPSRALAASATLVACVWFATVAARRRLSP